MNQKELMRGGDPLESLLWSLRGYMRRLQHIFPDDCETAMEYEASLEEEIKKLKRKEEKKMRSCIHDSEQLGHYVVVWMDDGDCPVCAIEEELENLQGEKEND